MMCFHHHQQTYFWFIVFKLWLPKYRLSRLKKTFPIFLTFVCLSIILVQPKLGLFWGFALFWLSHSRHTKYYYYCYILSHFTIDHGRGTFTFTFTCTWVNLVAPLFLISTKTMLTPLSSPFANNSSSCALRRIQQHLTVPSTLADMFGEHHHHHPRWWWWCWWCAAVQVMLPASLPQIRYCCCSAQRCLFLWYNALPYLCVCACVVSSKVVQLCLYTPLYFFL